MKAGRRQPRWAALLLVAGLVPGWALAEEPAADDAAAGAAPPPATREVVSLGSPEQRLFVVEANGKWSMHASGLSTAELLRLWHQAGGPRVVFKEPIDRAFTLSVHDMSAARIVERILVGYGYTLHYDASGRLRLVRVYSARADQNFQTPRLVDSLGQWHDVETQRPAGGQPAPAE